MSSIDLSKAVSFFKNNTGTTVGFYSTDGAVYTSTTPAAGTNYLGIVSSYTTTGSATSYVLKAGNWSDGSGVTIQGASAESWMIYAYDQVKNIQTGAGADSILSTGAGVSIDAGAGDDLLDITGTDATVHGGLGDDSVLIGGVRAHVVVDSGKDYIGVYSANATIDGTADADGFFVYTDAAAGNDSIRGGAGVDTIQLYGSNNDTIDGGDGADLLRVSGSSEFILSSSGRDEIRIMGGTNITVDGSSNASGIVASLTTFEDSIKIVNASVKGSTSAGNNLADSGDAIGTSLYGGAGQDTMSVASTNGYGDGGAGDDQIVVDNLTAAAHGGAGDDAIGAYAGAAYGEAGDDTLIAEGDVEQSYVTLSGGEGNDTYDLLYRADSGYKVAALISDYQYGKDTFLLKSLESSMFSNSGAIVSGAITASPLTASSHYQVTVETVAGGAKTNIWYTSDTASTMDASASTSAVTMYSTNNGDVSDTVLGSSRADTIAAGNGDYVYGGAGDDSIKASGSGIYIGLTKNGGTDTVSSFAAGYDTASADTIYLFEDDLSGLFLSSDGSTITAKLGSAKLVLNTTSANPSGILVKDKSGTVYEVAVANASNVITVTDDTQTNIYTSSTGKGSVDFTSVSGDVAVDLGNTGSYGSSSYYHGITTVKGGAGMSTLVGSSTANNRLEAGSGETSLYGGGKSNDTLVGGSAADTFFMGTGDGSDVVENLQAGFDDSADTIDLFNTTIGNAAIKRSGNDAVLTLGTAKLTLTGTTTAGGTQLKVADSSGTTYKVTLADTTGNIAVTDDMEADYYIGSQIGDRAISFAAVTQDITIDLGNTGSYGGTGSYQNLTTVKGGSGSTKLIGSSSANNRLEAGSGETSLYGGGKSSDTLVAGSAADTFYFGAGDGRDSISGFAYGTGDNADTLALYSGSIQSITNVDGTMVINETDGSVLHLNGSTSTTLTAASNAIAFTTDGTNKSEALIGQSNTQNTFVYDSSVTLYYGGKKGDTLQVTDSGNDKIWLDGSQGQSYNGIVLLDGSRASGDIQLAGNTSSNTIEGGSGTSSLWGGSGSTSDTLIGGSGEDSFYFGKGEGNDVIQSTGSSDKVMLYNVSLSDVKSAAVTSGTMKISLTDGSTLSIKDYTITSVNSFTLADGTNWSYSSSTQQWSKA